MLLTLQPAVIAGAGVLRVGRDANPLCVVDPLDVVLPDSQKQHSVFGTHTAPHDQRAFTNGAPKLLKNVDRVMFSSRAAEYFGQSVTPL